MNAHGVKEVKGFSTFALCCAERPLSGLVRCLGGNTATSAKKAV